MEACTSHKSGDNKEMKALVVLCLALSLAAANPGLQAALQLADVNQILMIAYAFGLTSAHFDLGNYDISLPSPLGQLSAELTNINITQISVDYVSSVFSFQSPNMLTYDIYDLYVFGTLGYSLNVGGFPLTPGNANLTVSGTNATVSLILSAENGSPQIAITNVALAIGTVDFETSLPAEFNEIINEVIAGQIANLTKLVPSLVAGFEPAINQALAGLDLKIALPSTDVAIDLGLASDPQIIDDTLLIVGLDGTVYQNGTPVPAGASVSIPPQGILSEGVQIGVTDVVVNSLLTPLWPLFNYSLATLPGFMNAEMTTDTAASILPELQEAFGKGLPVKLNIRSGGPISYNTNGDLNVNAHVLIDVSVQTGLFHWTLGATFAAKLDLVVAADVQNNVASASIKTCKLASISVVHSFIGTIAVKALEPALLLAIKLSIPKINAELKSINIPLPMGIGSFIQTDDVKIGTGYILAGLEL